jgi:hypothetical protein
MNVRPTHAMSMPAVLTQQVLLFVSVLVGILEMDLIVPVSKYFIRVSKILYLSIINHLLVFFINLVINDRLTIQSLLLHS